MKDEALLLAIAILLLPLVVAVTLIICGVDVGAAIIEWLST